MDQLQVNEIITKAQSGDPQAKNQLIQLMTKNNCLKAVGRYLNANRLLEPDDVRSEFWIGVVLAIPKVKTTIGDPLFYLSWSGVNRVKSQLRKVIGKGVLVICKECGTRGRLHRKNKEYVCGKCGASHEELLTFQKETNMTILNKNNEKESDINPGLIPTTRPKQLDIEFDMDLKVLKEKFTPQELKVFELIESGINREYEQNYLRTIALTLQISPQCVSQYLKKIKIKMEIELHYEHRKKSTTCKRGHLEEVYHCPKCKACRMCVEEGFEYGCKECS